MESSASQPKTRQDPTLGTPVKPEILYDDVYYDNRAAASYGLIRPEVLFQSGSTGGRKPEFLGQAKVQFIHSLNAAVLAQDHVKVGRLLCSSAPRQEDPSNNMEKKQVQRLLQVSVEFGDWKTLARLLLARVKVEGRKRPRLSTSLVGDKELVEASRRVVALGLHAANSQIASQQTCYHLLASSRIRDHHPIPADTDFTVADLCKFCEQDDLVGLVSAWFAFQQGGMSPGEFCELKSPSTHAPSAFPKPEMVFTKQEQAERDKLVSKSFETPPRLPLNQPQSPCSWPNHHHDDLAEYYTQCLVPNALNFHFASIVDLCSMHQAANCCAFLQALQSGRLR
ncbi:hypothetical protein BASA81_000502 [Batrachochytrium salamandrivorans]|nr:hypothetical protein BASA81_000502 [Batrachochytrium salamandrivorans]